MSTPRMKRARPYREVSKMETRNGEERVGVIAGMGANAKVEGGEELDILVLG